MRRFLTCLGCLILLAACGDSSGMQPGSPQADPYQVATSSPTTTPWLEQTAILLPSPTPILYTVVAGDTLTGIADRYGITLDVLQAANPDILPQTLDVGTQLVIPAGTAQVPESVLTPEYVPVTQAKCWPEPSSGMWCFALLQNDFSETLENISLQITLSDENGQRLASDIAYAPLNVLPAGARMPLGVHFPGVIEGPVVPVIQVLTAIRTIPTEPRYLPVMLENVLTTTNDSGRSVHVSGRVLLTVEEGLAQDVWVLGIAFDKTGQLVGFKRWDSMETLPAGESLVFDMLISSLGPEIEKVEFLSEARLR